MAKEKRQNKIQFWVAAHRVVLFLAQLFELGYSLWGVLVTPGLDNECSFLPSYFDQCRCDSLDSVPSLESLCLRLFGRVKPMQSFLFATRLFPCFPALSNLLRRNPNQRWACVAPGAGRRTRPKAKLFCRHSFQMLEPYFFGCFRRCLSPKWTPNPSCAWR